MSEHNFMGKQRNPFNGGVAIRMGPANEFVLAGGTAHQFGVAELTDDLPAAAFGNDVI
jgi:hypothetical protein